MSNWESPHIAGQFGQPGPGYVYVPPEGRNSSPPTPITSTSYPEDPARIKIRSLFSDKSIRLGFIRKVYSLLTCQLLLSLGIIAFLSLHPPTELFIKSNLSLFFIALGVVIVTLISTCCCSSVARKTPMNFICLFIFAGAEGFLVGLLSTYTYRYEILVTFGMTIILCFCLTLFAFQTKWDFTGSNAFLLVCATGFLTFGILTIFFHSYIKLILLSTVGAILFSFYFLCNTQLMMDGRHTYLISPEEYVFATLNLYLNPNNIFFVGCGY